jgi:hypothetical protein
MEAWLAKSSLEQRSAQTFSLGHELKVPYPWKNPFSDEKIALMEKEFDETAKGMSELADKKSYDGFSELQQRHIQAASGLLESRGVVHVVRTKKEGIARSSGPNTLEIVILSGERSSLNGMARGLQGLVPGTELLYDPDTAIRTGFLGAFRPAAKGGMASIFGVPNAALYTSEESIRRSVAASTTLRHELQHAYYAGLRRTGKPLHWMHGSYMNFSEALGKPSIFGQDKIYSDYMSFEEVATFGQDVRVNLMRLLRNERTEEQSREVVRRLGHLDELSSKLVRSSEVLAASLKTMPDTIDELYGKRFWRFDFDGSTYSVSLSDEINGPIRELNFIFNEVSRDGGNIPAGTGRTFSFNLALNSQPSPVPVGEALAERIRSMEAAGRRGETFVREVRKHLIRSTDDKLPYLQRVNLDYRSRAEIEAFLKTFPMVRDGKT